MSACSSPIIASRVCLYCLFDSSQQVVFETIYGYSCVLTCDDDLQVVDHFTEVTKLFEMVQACQAIDDHSVLRQAGILCPLLDKR